MTLSAVKKFRVLMLACFAFGLILFAVTISRNSMFAVSSMLVAHMALFVLVCTEAFGPISQMRSRTNKVVARLVCSVYALLLFCFIGFSAW